MYKESIQTFPEPLLCSQLNGGQVNQTSLAACCQGSSVDLSSTSRTPWGKGTDYLLPPLPGCGGGRERGSATAMRAERLQSTDLGGCFGSIGVWFDPRSNSASLARCRCAGIAGTLPPGHAQHYLNGCKKKASSTTPLRFQL